MHVSTVLFACTLNIYNYVCKHYHWLINLSMRTHAKHTHLALRGGDQNTSTSNNPSMYRQEAPTNTDCRSDLWSTAPASWSNHELCDIFPALAGMGDRWGGGILKSSSISSATHNQRMSYTWILVGPQAAWACMQGKQTDKFCTWSHIILSN